jgi:hypothetical protein
MCKEMPVIPIERVVDKKRIIGKNSGQRRRSGTRHKGSLTSPSPQFIYVCMHVCMYQRPVLKALFPNWPVGEPDQA